MEHYITEIDIHELRHLKNIKIQLDTNQKKHLILTGKNGAGKTTVLEGLRDVFTTAEKGKFSERIHEKLQSCNDEVIIMPDGSLSFNESQSLYEHSCPEIHIEISRTEEIQSRFNAGSFILAYFPAERKTQIEKPSGVEKIEFKKNYGIDSTPGNIFVKYLVDLKTQQAYALTSGDNELAENISVWFERFEKALCRIFDDPQLKLDYDFKNYDFKIIQKDKKPFGFDELSDGYSSILNIITNLIMRIDDRRVLTERTYGYDTEGIILIDELETHLHVELQKKIFPFLTSFFPKIQFIVTTHSPFILNSINNAVIYDLEHKIRLNDMSKYSYDGIVEGYFGVDKYSAIAKEKITRYQELAFAENLTDDERAERAELRIELKDLSSQLCGDLKQAFQEIELQRKWSNG